MTKQRFTFEEHVTLAQDLKALSDMLADIIHQVSGRYPAKIWDILWQRTITTVELFRTRMEGEMYREGHADASDHVYSFRGTGASVDQGSAS